MNDTPPAIQREFRRRIMIRTPEERLRMASSMHQTARTIALASMPPDADPSDRDAHGDPDGVWQLRVREVTTGREAVAEVWKAP